jgi:hypothetical protein
MAILLFIGLACLVHRLSAASSISLGNNSRLVFIGDTHVFHGAIHSYGFVSRVSEELAKANLLTAVVTFGEPAKSMIDLRAELRHEIMENDFIRSGDIVILMAGNDDINDLKAYIDERDRLANKIEGAVEGEDESSNNNANMGIEPEHIEGFIRQRLYDLNTHWISLASLLMEVEGVKIIVTTSLVHGEKIDGKNQLDEVAEEFSGTIKRFASGHENVKLFDARQYLHSTLENINFENIPSSVLTYDGFNLNSVGHKYVANFLLDSLEVKHSIVFIEDPELIKRRELLKSEKETEHVDLNNLDIAAILRQQQRNEL